MTRRSKRLAFAMLGGFAMAAPFNPAWAWGTLLLLDPPPQEDLMSFGASYWMWPASASGSDRHRQWLPAAQYLRHDGIFLSTESGAGVNFSSTDAWQAGFRLWPQWGWSHPDGTDTRPSLGNRLQTQAFANLNVAGVALLQSALSYGAGYDRRGVQTEIGVTSGIPLPRGTLGFGFSKTYANRSFRRDYTGMDAAGWSDWSWNIGVDQRLAPRWHLNAQWQQANMPQRLAEASGTVVRHHPSAFVFSLWRDL